MNSPAMSTAAVEPVRKSLVVAAPIALAFEVFTSRIGSWWPMASHHVGQADCEAVLIEPRVGGRWFERGVDGTECQWGHVRAWEPPSRLVLAWQLSAQWQFDPSLQTEVEVRFMAIDAATTQVHLEHRGLQAYGADALAMAATFASPNGWSGMLDEYARVAGQQVP